MKMRDLNRINFYKINRLEILLDNAISLLIGELSKQYDNFEEVSKVIQNELGCTSEELNAYGIEL